MSRQEDFIDAGIAYRMKHGKPMCIAGSNLADVERDFNRVISFEAGCEHGYQYALQHPQWIPVEEELPKCNIVDCGLATYPVLVYREDGFIDISCYDSEVGEWDCVGVVTHWMEIAPPRKEE